MAAQFKRTNSFSTAKADGNNKPKLEDLLHVMKLPTNGEWQHVRFVGPICSYAYHWFEISKKDGGKTRLPKLCLNYDSATETHDMTKKCPYCAAGNEASKTYFSNAIIREIEDGKPTKLPALTDTEEETGFKQDGSKSWTPVRVLRLASSVVNKLQKLTDLNFSTDKKTGKRRTHDIADVRYGIDVFLSEDANKKGVDRYNIQKHDRTALDEEQREYLVFDIEDRHLPLLESVDEANRECKSLVDRAPAVDEDDDDSQRRKRPAAGKSAKKSHVIDDDELDLDEEDEPAPKKKKAKPVEDFDDEAEDDEPKPKKKKPRSFEADGDEEDEPAPKKKKKPVEDFDDEAEDDEPKPKKKKPRSFEADDDEEDEPAPKKKKKPVEDFDLDDEEDEPAPNKKKAKPADDFDLDEDDEDEPAPVKKKKKPVEDFDLDDEDDEPKPKKKKPRPVEDDEEDEPAPKKKKAKPADDFDLDDDL